MNIKGIRGWQPAALAVLTLLAACGGSGSDEDSSKEPDKLPKVSVTTIGDSLADVGVFGVRYTVQSDNEAQDPFPLWPELVADALKTERPCPAYLSSNETDFVPQAACRGFAVAGGRIQHTQQTLPFALHVQMQDAADRVGAAGFGEHEILLIDGGGNDAADLITAYFQAYLTLVTEMDVSGYANFLAAVLGEEKTRELLWQTGGWEAAGHAYMAALSQQLVQSVQDKLLAHDAQRVVILNMPDVTRTPRLLTILNILEQIGTEVAGDNLDADGQNAADVFQALFQGWASTFNQTLAEAFKDTPQVAIVDFYSQLSQWATQGEAFGLTNTTAAVCPPTDPADLMPDYDITACTVTYLDAHPPAGTAPAAGWWKSYAFSDGFHPTPYVHELMAQAVNEVIADKGWN